MDVLGPTATYLSPTKLIAMLKHSGRDKNKNKSGTRFKKAPPQEVLWLKDSQENIYLSLKDKQAASLTPIATCEPVVTREGRRDLIP